MNPPDDPLQTIASGWDAAAVLVGYAVLIAVVFVAFLALVVI